MAPSRDLPDLSSELRGCESRRPWRYPRHHLEGRVPRRTRHRCGVVEPVLFVGPRRRWLRCCRLPRRRSPAGHPDGLRCARRRPALARDQGRCRHRAESQLRSARLVSGGGRRRPRIDRPRTLHLPRGHGAGWCAAAHRLGLDLRRPRLEASQGRPVVPIQLRRRAARSQLVEPGGPHRLRDDAAALVRSRGRRVPH